MPAPVFRFFEIITGHLLQLLFRTVERQPVVVGLDVTGQDRDVLASHSEERADIDDDCVDFAVLVEDQIGDAADFAVLYVVDRVADHFAGADLVRLDAVGRSIRRTLASRGSAVCA